MGIMVYSLLLWAMLRIYIINRNGALIFKAESPKLHEGIRQPKAGTLRPGLSRQDHERLN